MVKDKKCFDVDEARELISDPRYIIDEFVGAGAMACVYKVHERGTPNVYALKLLREQYRERTQFLEIFEREAIYMRDLQYPNIVRFYKFVIEERSAYILMDYVQGKPLTHYIQQARQTGEPIALDKIVRIMAQIARAISYLHTEGFIHRDIKPGNVLLVGEDEGAYLTDLGIAGAMDERLLTGAGTPSYMPYEQQTQGEINHTVDIYAFAIMLFEMFTSRKPLIPSPGLSFNEARKEMVELHRKQAIPSISTLRPELPKEMDRFFEQALAKNPHERYLDILDFVQDIHEVLLPQLPGDLQRFGDIQAQTINPASQTETSDSALPENSNLVISAGISAIAIIALLVIAGIWANNQAGINVTEVAMESTAEAVAVIEATAEITEAIIEPTPTLTDLPTEVTEAVETIAEYQLAEGVNALAYGEDLSSAIAYLSALGDGFVPLQFGQDVRDFSVNIAFNPETMTEIGLVFQGQSSETYSLFTVNAIDLSWSLERIENGESTVIDSDNIETLPDELSISVVDDRFTVSADSLNIERTLEQSQAGTVSLWIPPSQEQVAQVDNLEIILLGEDATSIETAQLTPLPVQNPLFFLLRDVRALRSTGNASAIVNCADFVDIYERLDLHNVLPNASDFVAEAKSINVFIFNRCQLEPNNTEVDFNDSFSDYLTWEDELSTLIDNLAEAQ